MYMKHILISVFIFVLSNVLRAQVPELIPFQAVARNSSGQPLVNTSVIVRFTIHNEAPQGIAIWQEMQSVVTNELGLFTVKLGSIIPLTNVNWSIGEKFVQIEIDLGSGFTEIGTQQMLSVPYALNAGNGFSNVSLIGDTLFLSNGNFLVIPGISDANSAGISGTQLHTCGAENVHNASRGYGIMTDQEGHQYKTIQIGSQVWMAENLNTGLYRNGDTVNTGLTAIEWATTTEGAWSYYNDDPNYACPFGKLYNWFACVDERQLCPGGWHTPNGQDWVELAAYLGGSSVAGGKMKSAGNESSTVSYWLGYNTDATNISGFSALPGGVKFREAINGFSFGWLGDIANFWFSEVAVSVGGGTIASMSSAAGGFYLDSNFGGEPQSGCSVRCIKD